MDAGGNRGLRLKGEPVFIVELIGEIVDPLVKAFRGGEVDVLAPGEFGERMRHVLPESFS